MATEISKDAQSVISGAPQGFQDYATANAPGNVLTSGEAQRLLNQFKGTDAYSAKNVQQAMTTPATAPNLSDPMGLYDYYVAKDPNIVKAQEEYQASFSELQKAKETGRAQQTQIENLPQALNVIRGEQAQAQRLSSDRIQALAEAADVSFSKLSALRQTGTERFGIAQGQRAELTNLITQYPGAKITYKDTIEGAVQKAFTFGKAQAEEARKTAYKDSLKAIALEYGLDTGGSTKKLEKRIKKIGEEARKSLENANKKADIEYDTAVEKLNQLREKGNEPTLAEQIKAAFGDGLGTTNIGGTANSSDDPLGSFGY